MRKPVTTTILMAALCVTITGAIAQNKTGCISLNELLTAMPEYKKADTTMAQYQDGLQQQFEAYKAEYNEQLRVLSSADTSKFSKVQLEVKRKALGDLYTRIQGFNQEANGLIDQKRQALLLPIQKKAADAIQLVAKESGYGFIIEKEVLHAYPATEDILPLVKKKLGLK